MKHFLTLGLGVISLVTLNAQTAQVIESYSVTQIQGIMTNFGVSPDLLQPQYDVDVYKVNYETTHPNGESWPVTGALAVPVGITCPLPLSSYQHGTIARKTDAPSYLSTETLLGVISASVGIVCSMPDYIGLGDSPGMHLYVHAESEALASIDLVRAVYTLQDEIGFELNDQLFLWGYSQGGHATMAMHKMIEEQFPDEFSVTASAPMSGPYDISGVQAEVLVSDQPYPTPGYLPYVVLSYQEVYGDLYESLDEVFLPQYAAIIPELFNGTYTMGYINNQFPSVPSQMLLPELILAYENDPEHPFRLALQDNDVYDWGPVAPVRLYYCTADDQVTYLNSIVCLEAMQAYNFTDVQGFNGGNLDHGACAPFAFMGGFVVFNALAEFSFGVNVSIEVVNMSEGELADGSITINLSGDPNATITWFDGTNESSLTGLGPGTFTFTVTNSAGCSRDYTVTVEQSTQLSESGYASFMVYPVPAADVLNLGEHTFERAVLFGLTGQMVWERSVRSVRNIDVSYLAEGVYILVFDHTKAVKFSVSR